MKNPLLRLQNVLGTQGLFLRDSIVLVGHVLYALPVVIKWPVRNALLKQTFVDAVALERGSVAVGVELR